MISPELLSRITHLEFFTRKKVSGPLLGDAQSRLKGSGFDFHQLRDYEQGDDIRFIDWKSSARASRMLIRQYLEDRNRSVMLLVDISASTAYSSSDRTKQDLLKELAAVLAFVGLHSHDSVGLILFTDRIEKIIPPRASRSHIFSLVQTLFSYEPHGQKTDLSVPLEYVSRLAGPASIVCLLSDFLCQLDERIIRLVSRRNDLLAFRCLDPRERTFPDVGTLVFADRESTVEVPILGKHVGISLEKWHKKQRDTLRSLHVDMVDCQVGRPFTGELLTFLRHRIY